MGVQRFPVVGLLDRVWELRLNITGYDATYVAVAEALDCALLTADGRLARAPGPRCPITVVRT
jgi:predicted nucleic acid-binding protein